MNIGQAAAAAGVSAKMVRHYEQIGLLPRVSRSEAGYRQYGQADVEVLRFIGQSRSLGFSMLQIGELLALRGNQGRASRRVKALAQAHLAELEAKLHELAAMRQSLQALIASCAGDDHPGCGILDGLAQGPTGRAPRSGRSAGAQRLGRER